jgi:hypothetical protein
MKVRALCSISMEAMIAAKAMKCNVHPYAISERFSYV